MVPQFDIQEIKEGIKNISKNKAIGIDLIPDNTLKDLIENDQAIVQLAKLINTCISQDKLPKIWTTGRLVVFNKTEGTRNFKKARKIHIWNYSSQRIQISWSQS